MDVVQLAAFVCFNGLQRVAQDILRNRFSEDYAASGAPVLPALMQQRAAHDVFTAATEQRDPEHIALYAGQSAGLVHDLAGAAEVVEAIVREARHVLDRLPR